MLRVSMFDAGKMIMEGMRGFSDKSEADKRLHFFKRNDAFFTDYGMMGLLVHQNYPKVIAQQYTNQAKTTEEKQVVANRLADATAAMSDFGVLEEMVRGGDQHWELLTSAAALCVQTGSIAGGPNGGFLPGFPEFPGWLGKNSSKGKHDRLLRELQHHMNVCVNASMTEIRSSYIPAFRAKIMKLMKHPEGPKMEEVISMMDEYGLSREDIFETMDEFCMGKSNDNQKFANIDSKVRMTLVKRRISMKKGSVTPYSQLLACSPSIAHHCRRSNRHSLGSTTQGCTSRKHSLRSRASAPRRRRRK